MDIQMFLMFMHVPCMCIVPYISKAQAACYEARKGNTSINGVFDVVNPFTAKGFPVDE